MKAKGGKGFWGWSRRVFRWMRITVWIFILFAALALLYLNKVGLPTFVKTRVVAALENEGLNLEFSRLRLSGFRHIVVDNMSLILTNGAAPLKFQAQEAELKFKIAALRALELKLQALNLRKGKLEMELSQTNAPQSAFVISNITAGMKVEPGDRWTLSDFQGEALGARWNISGSLTNLLSFAQQSAPQSASAIKGWTPVMRDVVDVLNKIEFSSEPRISIEAAGDLKEFSTFNASLAVRSEGLAKTPWGEVGDVTLRAAVGPSSGRGQQMEANLNLTARHATTPWGELRGGNIVARAQYPLTNAALFESVWTLQTDEITTRWFSGRKIDVSLDTRQAGTNLLTIARASADGGRTIFGAANRSAFQARLEHAYPVRALNKFLLDLLPVKPAIALPAIDEELLTLGQHWNGDWTLNFDGLRTKNGAAGKLTFSGDVRERPDPPAADGSWGFWKNIVALILNWRAEAVDFSSADARLEKVAATGQWRAPQLTIGSLDSKLYGGAFHLDAALDVATRKAHGKAKSDFDIKKIGWLLDPEVRPFLELFTWEKPPRVEARVELTAPPWVKPPDTWRRDMLQSTSLEGALAVGEAGFRGVTVSSLTTTFSLTNFQWRLPDAILTRPEGWLQLDYTGHAFEPAFRLAVRGGIDPWAALPLLDEEGQIGLKMVKFTQPPFVDGVLTGDLRKLQLLRFEGLVTATNAIVRDEPFLDFRAQTIYSNQWIYVTEPVAHRTSNEVVSASFAAVDIKNFLMYVTNGFSTTDPYRFTKMIGPITYNAIAPYIFAKPPVVRAEGIIPLKNAHDADIRFQIDGDDFAYWRFKMTKASAGVYWHREFLDVTNVTAKFYGGDMDWEGHFTFNEDDSANYRFKAYCTNADVSLLLRDLLPGATNKIDGTLAGTLVITDASSEALNSWRGHGEGTLRDGFLWDIPIFGIFSEPLNNIAPGFGKSRISSGKGSFRVENGRIYTKDMEVRAPAFRLNYDGSVDFDGNLDAVVEAQMFRDAWVFGRAVSAVFWPLAKVLESKISGNIAAPKNEFAHVPKIMLFPLRPVQTLKDLLPKDKKATPETEPERPQ